MAPEYRRTGVASRLMTLLEDSSDAARCLFVDLFVRCSNERAIDFYKKRGFVVYRRIKDYYSGARTEDAFDMRKALSADPSGESVVPITRVVTVNEIEFN